MADDVQETLLNIQNNSSRIGASSTEARLMEDDEISLFAIGSTIIRQKWRIVRWMVLGGALAVIPVLFQPLAFTATASFIPTMAQDPSRSGLAGLAGQLGFSVGTGVGGGAGQSAEFYADLLRTRSILMPIVMDSFVVREESQSRRAFLDLMNVPTDLGEKRVSVGTKLLSDLFQSRIGPKTGVVSITVSTPWPTLSLALSQRLIAGVNTFNLRTRQTQALEERQFTEARLQESQLAVRRIEDHLQAFLERNQQWERSPELRFVHDRLARDLALRQQILTSLAQSYEEVRIREVRNTPMITLIEQPVLPTQPDARGRTRRGLFGVLVGGFIACLVTILQEVVRRRRAVGDVEIELFVRSWTDATSEFQRLIFRR